MNTPSVSINSKWSDDSIHHTPVNSITGPSKIPVIA